MEDLTIAAINFRADFGQVERNLSRIRQWTDTMAKKGAEIVCFPELSVCGYENSWVMASFLESIPGNVTKKLQEIAADCRVTLIAGLAELGQDQKKFISQVVVSPQGEVGVYRKTHLSPLEEEYFTAGDELLVFEHPRARIGLLVCHDLRFPEPCTLLSLQGAEVIFVCMAATSHFDRRIADLLHRLLPARALDNAVFMVTCNQVGIGHRGEMFGGAAMAVDPSGKIIREVVTKQESVLKTRLKARKLQKARHTPYISCIGQRRPELYGDLIRSSAAQGKGDSKENKSA